MGGDGFLTRMAATLRTLLAALLYVYGSAFAPVYAAPSMQAENLDALIDIQERARRTLNTQIERYNETAQKKGQEAQSLLGKITKLRQEAQISGKRIKLLELQSKRLQESMLNLNRNIARIDRSMKGLIEAFDHRLLALYKYGPREELNLLLAAENSHEGMTMAYMLERLSRQDQRMIEELRGKIRELEGAKASLEKNRVQLARQTEELREQRSKHHTAIVQAEALMRNAQKQRQKALEAAREMEAAEREIGQRILALLHSRQSSREGTSPEDSRVESSSSRKTPQQGAPSSVSVPKRQNYTWLPPGSRLEWPLRGPLITLFGSRRHPVFKTNVFNSGIDIRAAAGAPVKAAGPGEVLFVGWLRGFGQVVIVNHGGNFSTVYAHLGSTSVGEGDAVLLGSLIGTVGNTGTSSEYSLHFEVRQGGAAKDPLNYLRRI